jgi:hypothetical protein
MLVVVLPTIPEDPNQIGPDMAIQLHDTKRPNTGQDPDNNLHPRLKEYQFYDTEAEDVDLEL